MLSANTINIQDVLQLGGLAGWLTGDRSFMLSALNALTLMAHGLPADSSTLPQKLNALAGHQDLDVCLWCVVMNAAV